METTLMIRNASRRIGSHPERSGFMMRGSQSVAIGLDDLHGCPLANIAATFCIAASIAFQSS